MAQDHPEVRTQLLRTLLSKIENETYPSVTLLDTVEELLTPEEYPAYAKLLADRIASERYPSIPMIRRLRDLSEG